MFENTNPRRRSTEIKHKEIYDRYNQILNEYHTQVPSRWRALLNSSAVYSQISDETGYGEKYICQIVNDERRRLEQINLNGEF